MMPYFSDPKELNTFTSFEEGLRTIESNLNANKSSTKEVYRLVFPAQKNRCDRYCAHGQREW